MQKRVAPLSLAAFAARTTSSSGSIASFSTPVGMARRLRAVAAVLRAAAGLDRQQRGALDAVGVEIFAVDCLRLEEQIVEGKVEEGARLVTQGAGPAGCRRRRGARSGPREFLRMVGKLLMIMENMQSCQTGMRSDPDELPKKQAIAVVWHVRWPSRLPALPGSGRRRDSLCDNCERLLPRSGPACPRCALPLPEGRSVRRLPAESAPLR